MKNSYAIILSPSNGEYVVYIPDFDIGTQGINITEAIEMARDAIGLVGITIEDEKRELPSPSPLQEIKGEEGDIVTLVDVDFDEYRRKNETKTVKKNCTLPGWLCYEAEKAHINFSQVLQNALKQELKISE